MHKTLLLVLGIPIPLLMHQETWFSVNSKNRVSTSHNHTSQTEPFTSNLTSTLACVPRVYHKMCVCHNVLFPLHTLWEKREHAEQFIMSTKTILKAFALVRIASKLMCLTHYLAFSLATLTCTTRLQIKCLSAAFSKIVCQVDVCATKSN